MKRLFVLGAALGALSLAACSQPVTSADQKAAQQQEQLSKRAQDEVGIYQPVNFTRKRLANLIGQMLDDPKLATISYSEDLSGKLHCIGHSIGFPLSAAAQTTSPQKWEPPPYFDNQGNEYGSSTTREGQLVPQPEPDQLYYPSATEGTWVVLVNQKTGVAKPSYYEGHVESFPTDVQPDPSLIAQACTA